MIQILVQTLAAFGGTIAFALLFSVPRQHYIQCGLIGACGWLVYSLLTFLGHLGPTSATFFSAFLVVFLSRCLSVHARCPATVFMITGIFPLVPGAGIYWTAYHLVLSEIAQAQSSGFAAFKAVCAIVLAIVAVFEIPNRFFQHSVKHSPRGI